MQSGVEHEFVNKKGVYICNQMAKNALFAESCASNASLFFLLFTLHMWGCTWRISAAGNFVVGSFRLCSSQSHGGGGLEPPAE